MLIMYCKNCGNEISEGAQFCPKCGARIEGEQQSSDFNTTVEATATEVNQPEQKQAKVWSIFATISKILGIVCLSTSVIPALN